MDTKARPVLVIGGGIAGMTAATEIAEVGHRVILVEKEAFLGGRVARSYQYFPKMCPPSCGIEINTRRIRQNPRITVHTLSTVKEISGTAGLFKVRISKEPRYITGTEPLDDAIADHLTSERPDDFNFGMKTTKALYRPYDMAYPPLQVIDGAALSDEDAKKLSDICPPGAIDLDMKAEEIDVQVGSIIIATGWRPYDAARIDNLGFGKHKNVITSVIMERLASPGGPTGGEILRPSDGKKPERVAFAQWAGSRDEKHLGYCSAVCCMASLKQARYLTEKVEGCKTTIFYIDLRTISRHEDFYNDLKGDDNISFIKGKMAVVHEDSATGELTVDVEDTVSGKNLHEKFDMVVLATGIVPNTDELNLPVELKQDSFGFLEVETSIEGVYAAGCAKRPCDVSRATKDSTAAALKAIQCLGGGE